MVMNIFRNPNPLRLIQVQKANFSFLANMTTVKINSKYEMPRQNIPMLSLQ
jgi:hypothetical protein